MSRLGWDASLKTGDKTVDRQHRALFRLVEDLHDAIVEKRGSEQIGKVIFQLIGYSETHFRDEEALMEKWRYPFLDRQRLQHAQFRRHVEKVRADYEEGSNVLPISLALYLREWLCDHIKGEDAKIVQYIESQRAAGIER